MGKEKSVFELAMVLLSEGKVRAAHDLPSDISKMEFFAKIVND